MFNNRGILHIMKGKFFDFPINSTYEDVIYFKMYSPIPEMIFFTTK